MAEKFWHAEDREAASNSPFPAKLASSKAVPNLASARFTKSERLCSETIIAQLFSEGKAVHHGSLTLVSFAIWLPTAFPAQAMFSVPKKNFKRATDRNRIKRLLRDNYRLQKASLYPILQAKNRQYALSFIYKGKIIPTHEQVSVEMSELLAKWGRAGN